MKPLFTPEQVRQLNEAIGRRFRQRMGAEPLTTTRLMSRRDGLAVTEGMCARCRKEMTRLPKLNNVIRWRCEACDVTYRIVDPRDEVNRLTGGQQ